MKFITIINKEVALGMSLNALAHMSVGIGHRLKGKPNVNIYFGSAAQVKEFRALTTALSAEQKDQTIVSDFPHTMSGVSGGTSDQQVALTASTAEIDMSYFGSCFVSETINTPLATLLSSCSQLAGYSAYTSEEKASILSPKDSPAPLVQNQKLSMLINGKQPFAKIINATVLSALGLGMTAEYSQLSLVNLIDKDGNCHPNISYHPFPILKTDAPAKHDSMAKAAESMQELVATTIRDTSDTLNPPLVTTVFGSRDSVEQVISRKDTRLFQTALKDTDLIPAVNVSSSLEIKDTELLKKKSDSVTINSEKSMLGNRLITFLGGGNITRALSASLIRNGHPLSQIMVSSRGQDKLQDLHNSLGVLLAKNNSEAVQHADVVVLAVKPQVVQEVTKEVASMLQSRKPFIISVATGIHLHDLDRWSHGGLSIVRAMPNTPALIGEGSTALFANAQTTAEQKNISEAIFNAAGKSFWLDKEADMDAITPLIGCGPAYVFMLMEAMENAAIKQGIKPELAKEIVSRTIFGAISMASKTETSVKQLRENVTTPNGVTEKALNELHKIDFFTVFEKVFQAAKTRCQEFGDELGKDAVVIKTDKNSLVTDFFQHHKPRINLATPSGEIEEKEKEKAITKPNPFANTK